MRRELICLEPSSPPRLQVRDERDCRAASAARCSCGSRPRPSIRSTPGVPAATAGACSVSRAPRAFRSCSATTSPAASRRSARACRRLRRGSASTGSWPPARPAARTLRMSWFRSRCCWPRRRTSTRRRWPCCPTRSRRCGWRVRATQLTAANAAGKRVLVHGAAGALGRLALQLLTRLGLPHHRDLRRRQDRRLPRARRRSIAVERGPQAIALAAGGLRRRAELRQLGRRTRARVAPGQRRARPRDDGASAARQLRHAGLGARCARQPARCARPCARPFSSDRRARATPGRSSSPTRKRSPHWTPACASVGFSLPVGLCAGFEQADRRVRPCRRRQARPCRAAALTLITRPERG